MYATKHTYIVLYVTCLLQIGFMAKGHWQGEIWHYLEGGAFLQGPVDFFGNFTGDNSAYLYPDLQHCILGTFCKSKLSAGQFCWVATIKAIRGI